MSRIFDNIEADLLPALRQTLAVSNRSDFCVGYFNLRGWKAIDAQIEAWAGGDGNQCRLLVGMQRLEEAELRDALQRVRRGELLDLATARRMREQAAKAFKDQLTWGCPTRDDKSALRRLSAQLRAKKLAAKLVLSHPLHAKLYLCFRDDPNNPITGFLGSSNLTFSGLSAQGELNVDVLDHDATNKLTDWFYDRWADRWCLDITDELADIIDQSWARPDLLPPYYVYLKMAWHLSEEARESQHRFKLPKKLHEELFPFQRAAVLVAAGHLEKRGGVLLGDVVGLGKTFMATALARLMEDRHDLQTLIVCPPNLVPMWQDYRERYGLRGRVISLGKILDEFESEKLIRYRLVIVDESHNLRNREGSRYKTVRDYIAQNAGYTVLLSATPFNKEFADVANQLRLFLSDDDDLGVRPERWPRDLTAEDIAHLQINPKTLRAFQESPFPDDWRDLMRLFLVRRTRSFIEKHYAEKDETKDRYFITYADGRRAYFPKRQPRTVKFDINESDKTDQYAQLFSKPVVDTIGDLHLPRYGLQKYLHDQPQPPPDAAENAVLADLNRAGKRLIGYVRTNLFKRLESCGHSFLLSLQRHILRNYILLHALNHAKDLPIGTQLGDWLDASDAEENELAPEQTTGAMKTEADFARRAAALYQLLATTQKSKFRWVRPGLFNDELAEHLRADAEALRAILEKTGEWDASRDAKLKKLLHLASKKHKDKKLLIFSQFADTVRYLEKQFELDDVTHLRAVTGDDPDPTAAAWAFSPRSNKRNFSAADETRVLLATDVLSEGQNLQDASIVVNFDLPWAIIRLIQRAGRVDRIGQEARSILCYSFLPVDGVERIIRLRKRVLKRLGENAEVVGSDEAFFEGETTESAMLDLYNERSGVLDGDDDGEVDLASYAYRIWKEAIDRDPSLQKIIPDLPPVVYSTQPHSPSPTRPEGVLVYMRSPADNDALVWMDCNGNAATESQLAILKAAKCDPDTPALPRLESHHELVRRAVELSATEERTSVGAL